MKNIDSRVEELSTLTVTKAYRFPSVFCDEAEQEKRQKSLMELGVKMAASIETALIDVDAVLLEINDPGLHADFFAQVADSGLPVFIDKPLAGNLEDAKNIVHLAKNNNLNAWSSSCLRYVNEVATARSEIPNPEFVTVYGPIGQAASGSDLIWYGCHAAEMLITLMGGGAKSVQAQKSQNSVIIQVEYPDGKRGLIECNKDTYHFGGRLMTKELIHTFCVDAKQSLYHNLLIRIRDWLTGGTIPVPLETASEVISILSAAEKSLELGQSVQIPVS